MSGSSHVLNDLIKVLRERTKDLEEKIRRLETKVKVHEDRADEWMTLYMKLEDKYNKLKEENKENGCN
jgi:chromosome segregation ATPase|tara:strand:+ start:785 stop:988 length:204 start_codon:yes stop_codon:yes gene_type:complete